MNTSRHYRLILVLFVLLPGLFGCTANKMHRPVSVQQEPDYTLAFVEFDDQGELWDPSQLSRALDVIERANQTDSGAVVITYVHGWQHNASEKSEEKKGGNVHDFKEFLSTLSQAVQKRQSVLGGRRHVVGVYLAWRGKSGSIPGLNLATFYDRAGAARRISGTSATEVIYRILSTSKAHPKARVVLMGHSFGGQILESAVTQAMVGELLDSSEGLENRMAADLVVLINPAAKSIKAKQFVEMLDRSHLEVYRTDSEGNRLRAPLMVSITSSADLATRWAFPSGTWISAVGKNFHRYPADACMQFYRQRSFYVRTPGHNEALISHRVTAEPLGAGETAGGAGELVVEEEFDPVAGQHVFSFKGTKYRFTVRSLTGAANDTPYWIMNVPRQLIPGHSGFFTEDTLRLIGTIFEISGALEPGVTTEIVRDTGVRPLRVAVLADGRVLVADASRRIYRVDTTSPTPVSFGCLPQVADATAAIGMEFLGEKGYSAMNRLSSKSTRKGADFYETLFLPFALRSGHIEVGKKIQLDSKEQYAAVAFDIDGQRVYLSGIEGKVIYVADLSRNKPKPELWLEVESKGVINDLYFDNSTGSLYALGGEEGVLYRLTEKGEGPIPTLIAGALGVPVGMAVDEERHRLYVGDAEGKQIWRLDCSPAGACAEPVSLVASDLFISPSELDVAPDGTVWVADREGRAILALSPEGEILQTISDLPIE